MNGHAVGTAGGLAPRRTLALGLALLVAARLATAAEATGDWRVTLLKPSGCQACAFVEESLKRRGTLQQVPLSDGAGTEVTATIERRVGGELTPEEWQQLTQLPYFDATLWKRRTQESGAQILLKQDGRIVAAGDITESTDLREARFPDDLTVPLGTASVDGIRAGYTRFFSGLFIQNWNFDWFFRLARDPSLASTRRFENWVERQRRPPGQSLGAANVLLASTGSGAVENPIFNAIRSEEIERVLTTDVGVDAGQIQVRYGAGNERGFNAVEQTAQGLRFVRRDVQRAESLTIQSLTAFFEGLRARPASRNLLVLIGHGGPEGAPLWGQVTPLGPEELKVLHGRGHGDDVLVSGTCYGGVLAESVNCAYFGARPDTVATGCQSNAAEVAQSQDYLHVYFEALTPAKRALADADGDGTVSFEEAHWYATRYGDPRNLTYSTVDALAERWFAAHPAQLPADISVAELQKLAGDARRGERDTLAALAQGLDPGYRIPLQDLAAQAQRYSARPSGPRPMLGQLARRLLYTQQSGRGDAALAAARACGDRSPASFLQRQGPVG